MADIDINDLGKMLNPEENIPSRMRKKEDPDQLEGQESLADLVKPQHKMTVPEVIERLQGTLEVNKRVKKNVKVMLKQISDKICAWKKKFGDLEEQDKAVARRMRNTGELRVKVHNVKTLEMKLAEFCGDIGLTADELHLIVFTSLDHDYLTNLIVLAGEFLKWFNINFEGENRDEIDFLDNKAEIWQAVAAMSQDITAGHAELLKKKESEEAVLTQKWWEQVRYSRFGLDLAKKLNKNQGLKAALRKLFKSQNDKLSYYDMF